VDGVWDGERGCPGSGGRGALTTGGLAHGERLRWVVTVVYILLLNGRFVDRLDGKVIFEA
jgi:hypothetical protein